MLTTPHSRHAAPSRPRAAPRAAARAGVPGLSPLSSTPPPTFVFYPFFFIYFPFASPCYSTCYCLCHSTICQYTPHVLETFPGWRGTRRAVAKGPERRSEAGGLAAGLGRGVRPFSPGAGSTLPAEALRAQPQPSEPGRRGRLAGHRPPDSRVAGLSEGNGMDCLVWRREGDESWSLRCGG